MRFRRTVGLTADQFTSTFKLVLYRLISGIIFFSLMFVILRLGLAVILKSAELARLKELLGSFFRTVFSVFSGGEAADLQNFRTDFHEALTAFVHMLGTHLDSIIGSLIGVVLMYILQRFVNGIALFAIASTVNDRMSVYARTRFASAYFKNIGKAALYHVLYVPLSFLYDVLSLLASWLFFFFIPSLLPTWGGASVLLAIALTLAAIICMQALKLTLISSWMPSMIADGKSVTAGLRLSLRHCGKGFWKRLAMFVVACYLVVFVNVGFALFTVGSGLILTIPTSYLFFLVMQFVDYYETAGKKYFVDKNTIAGGEDDPKPEKTDL